MDSLSFELWRVVQSPEYCHFEDRTTSTDSHYRSVAFFIIESIGLLLKVLQCDQHYSYKIHSLTGQTIHFELLHQ